MARNHHALGADLVQNRLAKRDHAVDVAAVVHVDVGIAGIVEHVAEMHRVVVAEDHRGVAGGVRRSHMHHVDFVAVEVEAEAVLEHDHRTRGRGIRFLHVFVAHHVEQVVARHHRRRVGVGDDARAGGAESEIAVGVVEVPMRVDGEVHALAADAGDGVAHFGNHLREHVVHDEHALLAHGRGDVAAQAEQHVKPLADLLRGHFGGVEVPTESGQQVRLRQRLVRRLFGGCDGGGQHREREQCFSHGASFCPPLPTPRAVNPANRECAWR